MQEELVWNEEASYNYLFILMVLYGVHLKKKLSGKTTKIENPGNITKKQIPQILYSNSRTKSICIYGLNLWKNRKSNNPHTKPISNGLQHKNQKETRNFSFRNTAQSRFVRIKKTEKSKHLWKHRSKSTCADQIKENLKKSKNFGTARQNLGSMNMKPTARRTNGVMAVV